MENRNSYTIVGMFFIACLTAFAIFIWWMTSKNNTKVDFKEYYIHTSELPSGLKVDSTVKFIGVPAGSVSDINFVDDKNALINITMKIREDLPIKADSVASIEVQAISGVASINISRGTKDFKPGDKPILKLEESLLSKLGNNAENITLKINQTLDKVDGFFSAENISHIESILRNIDKFTQVLTDENGLSEVDSIGVTVVMVTHDADSIFDILDRFLIIDNKKIAFEGDIKELEHLENNPLEELFKMRKK